MGWQMRDYGSDPPQQDVEQFTVKLHHGGVFKGSRQQYYVGGNVTCVDFCHLDEMSYWELVNMVSEVGVFTSVDLYGFLRGVKSIIKGDADAMELCKGVGQDSGQDRVVHCFAITTLPTQESQAPKRARTKVSNIKIHSKRVRTEPLVNEGGGDDDTDDYDPESSSSTDDGSDEDEIYDSEYEGVDDDMVFDGNVDEDVEFIGCGRNEDTNIDAPVVDNLADIDDDKDVVSSDELRSDDSDLDGSTKVKYPVFNEETDMGNPTFKSGQEFKTHALFREAVKEHAIKWGKPIRFLKSDRRQVRAKCIDGCPWEIYCSHVPNEGVYRVKTFTDKHTCVRSFDSKWVSTKWIIKHYSERIRKNPTWPIASLVETIETENTVNVHPSKAYRAKKKSLEMFEGTSAKQYSLLHSYAAEILKTNPGTTVKIKVKPVEDGSNSDEVRFKRFYICWGAVKQGFIEACRPVIGLDGCHLKGPHGGILLTAVGIDANNCIYPIAYAVVEKEKKKTWLWFLELLGEDLSIENSFRFTFMSDKQKGLIEAVNILFPNSAHRFCVRHMYNNFKVQFKGLVMKDILWKAARASTVAYFTSAMDEMKAVDVRAYDWLCERPAVNWSRSAFDTFPKCDILLNNLCESYNAAILPARDQPIITMLERIRHILMETIHKRREAMKRTNHPICPKIVKRLEKMKDDQLQNWIPRWFGSDQFEVSGSSGSQYKVDLANKTCGCRKWELSGIPCVHALVSIRFLKADPFDFVHDCYKVETYLKCYSHLLSPMNGKDLWPPTDDPILQPPLVKKRPGRPKKARRMEPEEPQPAGSRTKLSKRGVQMKCTACGTLGHNKRGCKLTKSQDANAAANAPESNVQTSSAATKAPASNVTTVSRVRKNGRINAPPSNAPPSNVQTSSAGTNAPASNVTTVSRVRKNGRINAPPSNAPPSNVQTSSAVTNAPTSNVTTGARRASVSTPLTPRMNKSKEQPIGQQPKPSRRPKLAVVRRNAKPTTPTSGLTNNSLSGQKK